MKSVAEQIEAALLTYAERAPAEAALLAELRRLRKLARPGEEGPRRGKAGKSPISSTSSRSRQRRPPPSTADSPKRRRWSGQRP